MEKVYYKEEGPGKQLSVKLFNKYKLCKVVKKYILNNKTIYDPKYFFINS